MNKYLWFSKGFVLTTGWALLPFGICVGILMMSGMTLTLAANLTGVFYLFRLIFGLSDKWDEKVKSKLDENNPWRQPRDSEDTP